MAYCSHTSIHTGVTCYISLLLWGKLSAFINLAHSLRWRLDVQTQLHSFISIPSRSRIQQAVSFHGLKNWHNAILGEGQNDCKVPHLKLSIHTGNFQIGLFSFNCWLSELNEYKLGEKFFKEKTGLSRDAEERTETSKWCPPQCTSTSLLHFDV